METKPVVPHVIITCGPAIAPIDDVRRITNFSTGELGVHLAETFLNNGWQVTCFKGIGATYRDPVGDNLTLLPFATNGDLLEALIQIPHSEQVQLVLHAAALSDFDVAEVLGPDNEPLDCKKIPSFYPEVRLILRPSFKLLPRMEELFPNAKIVGWKFEREGNKASAIACGKAQLELSKSALCILNGSAYGDGFGILNEDEIVAHVDTKHGLAVWLASWARQNFTSSPAASRNL